MEISVQTGAVISQWGAKRGYEMIKEAGFDGIDWGLDEAWNRSEIQKRKITHCIFEDSMEEILEYYKNDLEEIHKNGLKICQAHAPFPPYVKNFPRLNEYAIGIYKNCIRFCQLQGIDRLVIHGISFQIHDDTQTQESVNRMNRHLYESLIPVLKKTDVTVCMENLFTRNDRQEMEGACSNPYEACQFIDEMNEKAEKACFGFCVDTGHLNILGKNQKNFIRIMGPRVKALHLHDNWGDDDNHLAPYTGNIVWKDVLEGLGEIGYNRNLNFETYRQVLLSRIDEETAPIWLRTIHDIGEVFARKLKAYQ